MNRLLTVALFLVVSSSISTRAAAQKLPAWLLIKQENVLHQEPALPSPASSDPESPYRQSRARSLLAAGAGFVVSAAVHLAYAAPSRRCGLDHQTPLIKSLKAAGVIGGLGLALTIGGASWLAVESRRYGYSSSWQQRVGAVGIAGLSAVPSQALLLGMWLGENQRCD